MKRLEQLKLFGDGLVAVTTPALVDRYNETLQNLGLKPTELSAFHIDGIGWSPEIAEERGQRYYLSHGMANPLAVILTPDQRNKPIYAPFTSYDRRLMAAFFDRFLPEIADITRDTAICLDFDRQLSRFNRPQDLLLVRHVRVRSHAGKLSESGRWQQTLVDRLHNEEHAWFDANLRRLIRESAAEHGDLRTRRLAIPDLRYEEVQTFYTGLFGGLFVLRDLRHSEHLMILQHPDAGGERTEHDSECWSLHDPELVKQLIAEQVVDLDMDWYQEHPDVLREKMEYLAAEALCAADPNVDFGRLTAPRRRSRIRALGEAMPSTYFELERLIAELSVDAAEAAALSPELQLLLLHPHGRFGAGTVESDLIWQLLCRLCPLDAMRLYIADKELFFEVYKSWPESKKRWAAHRIASHYRPRMDR